MRSFGRYLLGALATAFLVAGLAAALFAARNPSPVLWSLTEEGRPTGEPALVIFNPFRDRSPEITGHRFLTYTRDGKFEEARRLCDLPAELSAEWVRAKREHVLGSFRLANRRDTDGGVELFYWTGRKGQAQSDFPLWISLSRDRQDSGWVVTNLGGWGW